jgi:hypothetical protein
MSELKQVGRPDPAKKTSPIVDQSEAESAGTATGDKSVCWFDGLQYGPGAEVCSGGIRLRCYSNGSWARVGTC